MDTYLRNRIIISLLPIFGGVIGLTVYLTFPFNHQSLFYNLSIILSVIYCIGGALLFVLAFTRKLPAQNFSPVLLILMSMGGSTTLFAFLFNPYEYSIFFVLTVLNFELVGFEIWLYFAERHKKVLTSLKD